MFITILCFGSRGDVQPFVALGVGLRQAGHEVCIATDKAFQSLVLEHNLDYAPVSGDIQRFMQGANGRAPEEIPGPLRLFRDMRREVRAEARQMAQDCWQASQNADLLVTGGPGAFVGATFSEKRRIPYVQGYLQPVGLPTRAFPSSLIPPLPLRTGWFNRLTHLAVGQIFWQVMRGMFNEVRREMLELPPWSVAGPYRQAIRERHLTLMGYSPHVLPLPPDWDPDMIQVTGYWWLPPAQAWQPPPELCHFLAAGTPPVYIGFGSVGSRDAVAMTQAALDALAETGQRGILLRGWGGLAAGDLPETVLMVENVPHDWLFPQMAAVVHHGGAGTTGAGLRAGIPSLIIPHFADQPFWGEQVRRLGVGPKPIPKKKVTAAALAAGIRTAVADPVMQERARQLGRQIQAEDGVAQAVALIETYAQRWQKANGSPHPRHESLSIPH